MMSIFPSLRCYWYYIETGASNRRAPLRIRSYGERLRHLVRSGYEQDNQDHKAERCEIVLAM